MATVQILFTASYAAQTQVRRTGGPQPEYEQSRRSAITHTTPFGLEKKSRASYEHSADCREILVDKSCGQVAFQKVFVRVSLPASSHKRHNFWCDGSTIPLMHFLEFQLLSNSRQPVCKPETRVQIRKMLHAREIALRPPAQTRNGRIVPGHL